MCNRDQLIIDNLDLARWHASRKQYRHKSPAVSFDDLFQAACVGLVKAADTWEGQTPFDWWAGEKIRAEIVGELRRMRCRFRHGHGIEPDLEIHWEPLKQDVEQETQEPHIDVAEQVEHLLSRLSYPTREMMRLHLGLEWPATQIAEPFGCSRTTVANRIRQAIALLRTD